MHDRPRTPPSPAVRALQKVPSSRPQTPRFDPEVHKSEDKYSAAAIEEDKDAFVEAIISRTPAKMLPTDKASDDIKEDFSVARTQTISPTKSVTRIEDSFEAMDAFEEEIEKVGELLPAIDDVPPLPMENMDTNQSMAADNIAGKPTHPGSRKPSNESKLAASRNTETKAKTKLTSAARPAQPATRKSMAGSGVSRKSSVRTTASSKASPLPGPTKAPAATHARISSLQNPPFQPAKSSKPPTRSTFELPGEAISRKLKEQREERLKKEAAEDAKKKSFKARPVRLSHAPVIKPTATSKARIGLAKADPTNPNATKNQAPKIKPMAPRESMATTDSNRRLSSLTTAKRCAARSSRGPSLTGALPSRTASITSRASLTTSPPRPSNAPPTGNVRQTSRGKEVFGRTKAELEAREKEKKEKEEAARRARVDAAERGRLASRMWAEKQKAKKMGAGARVGAEAEREVQRSKKGWRGREWRWYEILTTTGVSGV